MSCDMTATNSREHHLMQALRHLMYKNHELWLRCDGCLEIAAFLAIPGYRGNGHPEVH